MSTRDCTENSRVAVYRVDSQLISEPLLFFTSALALCCASFILGWICYTIVSTIGPVILQDDINLVEAVSVGLSMLRPPALMGRANNALSRSLRAAFPVRMDRKHLLIASSSGSKRSDMLGIMRIKYDHFPMKPCDVA